MAHLLTLEGDPEISSNSQEELLDVLAETLAGDVPEGFEAIEIHGDFFVTDETEDELYGDAEISYVVVEGPSGLNGELGRFGLRLKSPFRFKGFRMPKMPSFKGLKLGKVKLPFKANIKGLQKSFKGNIKGLQKSAKSFSKGLSKGVSKFGEALSQGAEGLMDMASGMMPGAGAMPEEEMPPEEEPVPEEPYYEQPGAQDSEAMKMAEDYGPAWFDAADEMAGELGKSSRNKMLGMNLLAMASGNPQIMKMAALANINQAQRNQATRNRRRQQTQALVKTGLSVGAGVLTGGVGTLLPGLSGVLGSGGLGMLTQALGPMGSSLQQITQTLGVTGLQDFAGLMGPGGVSSILEKLGSGGLGDVLSRLGPDAAKLATSEGAKRLVQSLGRVQNSDQLFNTLRNALDPVPAPPPEIATVEQDRVTFTRRDPVSSSDSGNNNTMMMVLLVGGGLLLARSGKR